MATGLLLRRVERTERERERMVGGDLFYLTGSPSLGGKIGLCSCDWRELKAAFGCWE